MNPQHNQVRQALNWTGLILTLFLLLSWIASMFVSYTPYSNHRAGVSFSRGGIAYWKVTNQQAARPRPYFHLRIPKLGDIQWIPKLNTRIYLGAYSFLPMWLPFFALAIPTYVLWRRDQLKPEGYCQKCNYNLTGNESGVCPECGEAVIEAAG